MKVLLDTHIILWAITEDERLGKAARELITAPENLIFYSVASLWEIAIKNQKAPEKCPYQEEEILKYCEQAGYLPMDIRAPHVFGVRSLHIREGRYLSNYDPFDRILLAQAKMDDCMFITHDTAFENYDEKCIVIV